MHSPAAIADTWPSTKEPHHARKKIPKLMLPRVDMGRWFGTPPHLRDQEIECSFIISMAGHLANKRIPLYQVELFNAGDRL